MRQFRLNPLILAMAVALPSAAMAQEAQEDAIEEIVVTGSFRDSLANALNVKRNATGAVDAIVAEDIADFPDLNLAESLQRIPGVAISRVAGEGRQISVRGLGSGFTRTRINGMEAVATGGSTDAAGGANRTRSFDFNTFSSELFTSLAVRKTASADVEEGSLGATVDMDTAQPFDYDDFTFAASGQLGYNDLSEKTDPKVSFLISNTFADDTFGALLSVSYSERNIKDQGASTVRWDAANPIGTIGGEPIRMENPANPSGMWVANPDYPTDVNGAFRPRLPRYDSYTHEMERLGVSGSLQFRPTDVTEISLDALYSKYDAARNEIFMQGIVNSGGIQNNQFLSNGNPNPNWGRCVGLTCNMVLTDYEIDDTNTMTAASFNDATVRAENRYDELTTEFTQITLSAKHEFSDSFRFDGLIGRVESDFDNPIQTTIVAEKRGLDFAYDYSGSNRENPMLTFDNEVSNLSGWNTNSVRLRPLSAQNTYDAAQANLEFDLNDSLTLRGGLNYKNFEFETTGARRASENNAGVDLEGRMMPYDSGLGSNNPWAVPNFDAIVADYDIYSNTGVFEVILRKAEDYSVTEETIGGFIQLAFDTTLGDTSVRGDVGVRQVETDIEAIAWSSAGDLVIGSHDYSDTLPSINLVFEPIDDVLIRLGYSEVIARAGLGSLLPNTNISVSGGSRTVSSGNPALEPTRAAAYDLGVELYMSDESVLGLAVFYKDIESFVQTVRETRAFTTTGLPTQLAVQACNAGAPTGYGSDCNENVEWDVNGPVNAPGGDLYGFELSYQTPFTALPGILSNFGFIGNFTYVEAEQDFLNSSGEVVATRSLLGLSQDTTSGTLYYEDDAFSARVSAVNRSGYLTNATGRNNNDREGTNGTTNIDASASYQFNDNIKFTLEALNLTDEVDDQWVDASGNRLSYYHSTGRQYYLGVQYKY